MKTLEQIQLHPRINTIQTGADGGSFYIDIFNKKYLAVIASFGGGWDHVSVSLPNRCPTWNEMCHVKDLFFNEDEVVVQYHPAKKDYINTHPFCLHMWKQQGKEINMPPKYMVG